jgi:hypothetical protein
VSEPPSEAPCRNCERPRDAASLDAFGWCPRCRGAVIRRATLAARLVAALGLAAAAYWVFSAVDPGPRSLIVWLIALVAVYGVLYKVTQRVAFEVIRSRGVPPPES